MRCGRIGKFVDNGGSGGIIVGIDTKSGRLATPGYNELNECFEEHPDSHVHFVGYQIPQWDRLLFLCREAAKRETGLSYLSWDLAYTEKGWVVIEVNEVGQFIGPQIAFKKGIKNELFSYLDSMDKVI